MVMAKLRLFSTETDSLACQRIEENDANKSEFLDLGGLVLECLPESIRKLRHLRVLMLGRNALLKRDGKFWLAYDRDRPFQHFTDLTPLAGLITLTKLDLGDCGGVADLSPLSGLTTLTKLGLGWCGRVTDLSPLAELTALTQLDLKGCEGVTDLSPLSGLTALTQLDLGWCGRVTDLSPLAELTALTQLDLGDCGGVTDLSPLSGLTALTQLDLSDCKGVTDLSPLSGLTALTQLNLRVCRGVTDLSPLAGLTALAQFNLCWCEGVTNLSPLAELTALTQLVLNDCKGVTDLSPLARLTALTQLDLNGCKGVTDLSPLSGLTALTQLDLGWCGRVTDLSPLARLTALTQLDLNGCKGVTDLSPLSGLTALTKLGLGVHEGVTDLSPLSRLTALTQLDLKGCEGVTDLSPLAELTALTQLDLGDCGGVTDLSPLSGLTALTQLDLSDCKGVTDLFPLSGLIALTQLNLRVCRGVTDLSPLAELTALTQLVLKGCEGVTDLSPLSGLAALTQLVLTACQGVPWFEPIQHLLGHLEELILFDCRFDDLPAHLYGENAYENVAGLVRRYYGALNTQGSGQDAECKLLVVGNGAAGKTSLVRLILGEPHRDDESSTHAIHLEQWQRDILLTGNVAPVSVGINMWDFGGQDLYHETHRLFFQSGAAYLLVWDPWEEERPDHNAGSWYTDKKRPLQYWVDQIVSIDPFARILIVRNKADLDGDRNDPDWREQLARHQAANQNLRIRFVRLSAKDRTPTWRAAHRTLFNWIREAVATVLGGPEKRAAGQGRLRVKEVLRRWQKENDTIARANEDAGGDRQPLPHPFMTRADFDRLVRDHCKGSPDADDTTPVLQWLHRTGVVFWNERLFGGRIVVDQRWAIQGIYWLLDREHTYHELEMASGVFTPHDLDRWAWDGAGYKADEQGLFLSFMQSCGLCFQLLTEKEAADGKPVYVAPQYLPEGDESQVEGSRRDLRRGLGARPKEDESVAHQFLGEGVAAAMINRIGARWSRAAVFWRWGVAFASAEPGKRAVAEVTWSPEPGAEREFGGRLRVTVWGPDASDFLPRLLTAVRDLPGFPKDATFRSYGSSVRSVTPGTEIPALPSVSVVEGERPGFAGAAPDRRTAVGRRLWISASGPQKVPTAEDRFQKSLLVKLRERSASAPYQLISWGYSPDAEPEEAATHMRPVASSDLILVFLTHRYLFFESRMAELVQTYKLGSPGFFPSRGRARLWRLPSAEQDLACEQPDGHGISATFKDHWRRKIADYDRRMTKAVGSLTGVRAVQKYDREKRGEPYWQLFEFVADEAEWGAFLTALAEHVFETHPLIRGTVPHDEMNAYAEKTANEFHRLMTSPDAVREPPATNARRGEPEGLERKGAMAEKLRDQLKTFLYMGAVLRPRGINSLKLGMLSRLFRSEYDYKLTPKSIGRHLRLLEKFFNEYCELDHPGKAFEFFDRGLGGQGRPPEILKDGWDMWEETRRYFERQGLRLDDRTLGRETKEPTQG
jgi:internalin A